MIYISIGGFFNLSRIFFLFSIQDLTGVISLTIFCLSFYKKGTYQYFIEKGYFMEIKQIDYKAWGAKVWFGREHWVSCRCGFRRR